MRMKSCRRWSWRQPRWLVSEAVQDTLINDEEGGTIFHLQSKRRLISLCVCSCVVLLVFLFFETLGLYIISSDCNNNDLLLLNKSMIRQVLRLELERDDHIDCKSLRVSSTPSSRSWFFSFSCRIWSVMLVVVVRWSCRGWRCGNYFVLFPQQ